MTDDKWFEEQCGACGGKFKVTQYPDKMYCPYCGSKHLDDDVDEIVEYLDKIGMGKQ